MIVSFIKYFIREPLRLSVWEVKFFFFFLRCVIFLKRSEINKKNTSQSQRTEKWNSKHLSKSKQNRHQPSHNIEKFYSVFPKRRPNARKNVFVGCSPHDLVDRGQHASVTLTWKPVGSSDASICTGISISTN